MARSDVRLAKIRRVLALKQPDLTMVLENIHDPHNVSAIFRTGDAVGVKELHLLYTTEQFPKIGKKSSSSAHKWMDRRRHRSVAECFSALRAEGFRVLATSVDPRSVSLYDLDLTLPTAFVLGNEHRGVSEEAASGADSRVLIPMMGMIQSLNVSVAAAIFLYEALRQRLAAGAYAAPRLAPGDLEALFHEWIDR